MIDGTHLVIASDFFAISAEQERGVVNLAVVFENVTANDEIYLLLSGRVAEALKHPVHRFGEHLFFVGLIHSQPIPKSQGVLGQGEGVTFSFTGLTNNS